jgi:murein DD-endopeptidase MepM/ murein hydrolase activator NlpD
MKRKKSLCFILLVFAALSLPVFSDETIHILKKGETIYSIARFYGVSASAVLSLNGMTEADAKKVQAGYRLKIPDSGSGRNAGFTGYGEHRVVKSETFYSIARRFDITVTELLDMNGFSPSYVLKEGEKIRVPGAASGESRTSPADSSASGAGAPPVKANPVAAQTPAKADAGLKWPVAAKEISYMTGKLYGVMVTGEHHEPVKSLTQGTVVSAVPYRGFGRVAIVQVSGGYLYVYGGCETLLVKEGDKVAPGTELGRLGIDAKSEKPRLFFLVYRSNNPIDPAKAPRN